MDIDKLFIQLAHRVPQKLILKDEPMKNHTSFRIGGPADLLLLPSEVQHIRTALEECRDLGIPFYVMGNGSNLLVSDRGFRGLIIKISDSYSKVNIHDNIIWAQAGALISTISKEAIDAGLSGLEFAVGIPGTLGGATAMNAGAYTREMKEVIQSVLVLTSNGEEFRLTNSELEFSYRNSLIQEQGLIMLEASMVLTFGEKKAISELANDYTCLRQRNQPLSFPSAGSIFKRPPDNFAGKLIYEAGLRGLKVGDARISEQHCGFIINSANATANDVIALIDIVRNEVKKKTGIELLLEVKIIGE